MQKFSAFILILLFIGCSGIGEPLEGLRETPPGDGPEVIWDIHARPIPDIPLPNDIATLPDPSTPTGKRLNFSTSAPTRFEQYQRKQFNRLDGFATFAPVTISFNSPIDIEVFETRHRDHDFKNDAVYLLALDTGEPVELDLGRGNFPMTLWDTDQYFTNDSRSQCVSLVVDCVEEDLNHNGILDPGEDTDGDGILDQPNVKSNTGNPYDDVLTYFDLATNTLMIQPVVPLREATTYAVILTDRLVGESGHPVRSPFAFVNHTMQTEQLRGLPEYLERLGASIDDVAFTWTFTTGSVTRDLLAVRDGLYGKGPFYELKERFPPEVARVTPLIDASYLPEGRGLNVHTIPAENIERIIQDIIEIGVFAEDDEIVSIMSFDNIDYFIAGEYVTSDLRDTVCPDNPMYDPYSDHAFYLNYETGTARAIPCRVPFFAAIPKQRPGVVGPPFSVVLNAHGTGLGQVITVLGDSNAYARFGIATIGIPSSTAMSLPIPPEFLDIAHALFATQGLGALVSAEFIQGQAVDLSGDGAPDSAGDMWSGSIFKSRENVRQTIVDHFQLVRVLRSFDGQTRWGHDLNGDGQPELAGDFNADGVVDLGGPDASYFTTGMSQGGIISAILGAVEPYIIAAAPNAPAAGMAVDAFLRSSLRNIVHTGFIEIMGPLIVGTPAEGDLIALSHSVVSPDMQLSNNEELLKFAEVSDLLPGMVVTANNLTNGEQRSATVRSDNTFRIALPSDMGDQWEIRYRPNGADIDTVINTTNFPYQHRGKEYAGGDPLVSPYSGLGYLRGTKELRQMLVLGQIGLEPGDPIAYAPLYSLRPPGNTPGASTITNLLLVPTIGDDGAVISGAIALGRAAGLISYDDIDPRFGMPPNDYLISNYVVEGISFLRFGASHSNPILFDPDDLSFGRNGFDVPRGDPPLRLTVNTEAGVSGVRIPIGSPKGGHTTSSFSGDYNVYLDMAHRIGYYFYTGGTEIIDDPCLEDGSCPQFPE